MTREQREQLIRRYAHGPELIEAALARVPAEARSWKPAPDRWSVHEIVVHCADAEMVAATRIRFVAGEPKPPAIVGYDQDAWVRQLDYAHHPLEPALAMLVALRAHTVPLLRRLPEDAWLRAGAHTESGRYTAERWLELYAEHLEAHARQIERTLAAWQARDA